MDVGLEILRFVKTHASAQSACNFNTAEPYFSIRKVFIPNPLRNLVKARATFLALENYDSLSAVLQREERREREMVRAVRERGRERKEREGKRERERGRARKISVVRRGGAEGKSS